MKSAWVIILMGALCSTAAAEPDILSIQVWPARIALRSGESHRLLVTGADADGFLIDSSRDASYHSDSPEVAKVEDGGLVRGLSEGVATITATARGRSANVRVTISPAPADRGISFVQDVMPVLSKAGCNAGACHAKPDGQNGFKLSVFAHDLKSDYREIVKDGRGRRIFPAWPEESLLLKKPTMSVEHGGGKRFDKGSAPYRLLQRWIEQGMPFSQADDSALVRVEVLPREERYRKGARQALLVRARYADGSLRDVTHLADFSSNDKEIARVDEHGTVRVGDVSGEAVVVARFMGLVDVSRITVPAERILPESLYAALPVNNFIDRHVHERLRRLGVLPSDLCSDNEFIRRASLDAVGVLPTPEDVRAFLNDHRPDKRERLIDDLLNRPQYADYWATKWGDLIRPNTQRVGVKSVYLLDQWIRESFRRNKPYDQFVREILTAQGGTHRYGPVVVFRDRREPGDLVTLVSQVFLGVRMECAKCHHHPNEKWGQEDFYQLAAFFGQIKRKGQGISAPISGEPEYIWFATGGVVKHPVSGEVMAPKPLDGETAAIEAGQDPREALAEWMTGPENAFFARAIANRIWASLMGRGVVEPVDDFRASNPPTNEALLDELARDFVRHGYDLKHLIRTIMRSRTYQLSSSPNEYNIRDTKNFSRSYRRRLPAEVLLDAVSDVTGAPEPFDGLPAGSRAIQTWNYKLNSEFLDAFGRPDSSADCPCERDLGTSVVQALHLMNSNRLQAKIANPEGRAATLAAGDPSEEQIVTELYLAAYARPPDEEEMKIARGAFDAAGATRRSAAEDIMWALINSAEFVFNH